MGTHILNLREKFRIIQIRNCHNHLSTKDSSAVLHSGSSSSSTDDVIFQGEQSEIQDIHARIDDIIPRERIIFESIVLGLFDFMPEESYVTLDRSSEKRRESNSYR